MSFCFTGQDQLDSKTLMPTEEGKPASKPSADAAAKDAAAKDAAAKDASAKDASASDALAKDASVPGASAQNTSAKAAVEKGASENGASARDSLAMDASAKDASAKSASAKFASAKGASAKTEKPERNSLAGRGSHKASENHSEKVTDKGHLVARDSRRSDDRPQTGRSGQKRARSRYMTCTNLECGANSISLQGGNLWSEWRLQNHQTLHAS